jgi:hypothetical protein
MQQPVQIETARRIARQAREEKAVCQHDLSLPQRWKDLRVQAMPEIGGVQEGEFSGSERVRLLARLDERLDERRRVPFARHDVVSLGLQPGLEQFPLRRLARAIRPFERDEQAPASLTCAQQGTQTGASGTAGRHGCGTHYA